MYLTRLSLIPVALFVTVGCGGPQGIALLGGGTHTTETLAFEVIADSDDGLNVPRDLEINSQSDDELWIVNRGNSGTTILFDFADGDGNPESNAHSGQPLSTHFLAEPSALAFGDNGLFATIHETDDLTQGAVSMGGSPKDFMGPTTWPADADLFEGGHSSHMDMLHNSPNGMGIAWQQDSVYWVFDGYHGSITEYDFGDDHGPGGADHSDGRIRRFVEGEVEMVDDVPSHMVFDDDDELYIADTGNSRIALLDTDSGDEGGSIAPNYDTRSPSGQKHVEDADLETIVDGDNLVDFWTGDALDIQLEKPSGIELYDDDELGPLMLVTDNSEDIIFAFDMDGNVVDWVEVEVEHRGLMGLAVDGHTIYFTDAEDNTVTRMTVNPS